MSSSPTPWPPAAHEPTLTPTLTPTPPPPGDVPAARKNGLRPSCEPCRISKARCDHAQPCARCTRQGKACVYHPAPMSRGNAVAAPAAVKRPAPAEPDDSHKRTLTPGRRAGAALVVPLFGRGLHAQPPSFTGYMGKTSFGAILQENDQVRWEELDGDSAAPEAYEKFLLDLGTAILSWMPDRSLTTSILKNSASWGFGNALVAEILRQSAIFFDIADRVDADSRSLRACALAITKNTMKKPTVPTSNQDWIRTMSTHGFRWELIGSFFALMGFTVILAPQGDPLPQALLEGKGRRAYLASMLELADAVVSLVERLGAPASMMHVQLLLHCVQLQSSAGGDTSYELWKRHGMVSTAVTGMGLHLKASAAESRSPLYQEARSSIFLTIFLFDKIMATFLGRPPALNRRFVSIEPMLDVDTEDLFADMPLESLQAQIGPAGWNHDGVVRPSTRRRAFHLECLARDEVLELALAARPADIQGQVTALRARLQGLWDALPAAYRAPLDRQAFSAPPSRPGGRESIVTGGGNPSMGMAEIRLMHLHTQFLLERLDPAGQDCGRFFTAAHDMLALVILLWTVRDQMPECRDNIHWYITSNGIPAGSALAVDLWQQTRAPHSHPEHLPRSTVIQNLSLFVACLEWVGPEDGNYALCGRVAKMIAGILDKSLAPEPAESPLPFDDAWSLGDLPAWTQELDGWLDMSTWSGTMQC